MPPIYAGTQVKETDSGKATIQGIVADNAWFPDQGLRFNPDFIQPYRYTISHVETKPEHAVVWTAPEDIRLDDPDLMTKIMVNVEEGGFLSGKRQPDKRFFHAIAGEGNLLKLPFDEKAVKATATLEEDGRSVFSMVTR